MENNPYDTSLEWTNFHPQSTENVQRPGGTYPYPLTPSYQMEKARPRPASPPVRRLSKSEALEMLSYLKGYIVVGALLGFALLSGLIANQIFATNAAINQPQLAPGIQGPSVQNPDPSAPSNSGGFFNGQGQGQGGGYGFGQGNNSSPFSGSHTS